MKISFEKIMYHVSGIVFLSNATLALWGAMTFGTPSSYFCLYVAISPLALHFRLIKTWWLSIEANGNLYRYLRASILWPISIYESQKCNFIIKEMNAIVGDVHIKMKNGESPKEEIERLKFLRKRLGKFGVRARKRLEEESNQ